MLIGPSERQGTATSSLWMRPSLLNFSENKLLRPHLHFPLCSLIRLSPSNHISLYFLSLVFLHPVKQHSHSAVLHGVPNCLSVLSVFKVDTMLQPLWARHQPVLTLANICRMNKRMLRDSRASSLSVQL